MGRLKCQVGCRLDSSPVLRRAVPIAYRANYLQLANQKSPEQSEQNLLRGSRLYSKTVLQRTNATWQADTHMVLAQTKYTLIHHHAMPQIIMN